MESFFLFEKWQKFQRKNEKKNKTFVVPFFKVDQLIFRALKSFKKTLVRSSFLRRWLNNEKKTK